MTVFMSSTAVNTIGNYLLIFGRLGVPALGITGAATATLLSRALELLICAVHLLRDRRLRLTTQYVLLPGSAMVRSFTRYVLPVLLNETLWGAGTSMYAVVMGHMRVSTDILAAYTVAGGVDRIIVAAEFGLAIAAGVIRGVVFEVKGYMRDLQEQIPHYKTIITGGNAPFILHGLQADVRFERHLVLIGLNQILLYNTKQLQ
jgi:Na+-driven multidrug efflux pump